MSNSSKVIIKKLIPVLLIICLMFTTLVGCAGSGSTDTNLVLDDIIVDTQDNMESASHPSDILHQLENAYNTQNLYEIVECFEPSMASAAFEFMELFRLSGSAMKQIVPFASQLLGTSGALDNGQWGTAKLSEISTEINGDSATLAYSVTLSFSDSSMESMEDTIQTVLIDDVWYIAAIQIPARGDDGGVIGILPELFDGELYITGSNSSGYGFMDEYNHPIISKQYKQVRGFVNGYCAVSNGSAWGVIDKSNRLVIPYLYQDIGDFADGLFPVKLSEYWGCINEAGETVIDFMYNDSRSGARSLSGMASRYRHGRMAVSINGTFGVIDTQGNYVISLDVSSQRSGIDLITDSFILCRVSRHKLPDIYALYDISGDLIREDVSSISGYAEGMLFATVMHEDFTRESLIFLANGDIITLPEGSEYVGIYNGTIEKEMRNAPNIIKWIPIKIKTGPMATIYNCIDGNGNFFFDEWSTKVITLVKNGLYLQTISDSPDVIENDQRVARIFDIDGNLIYEYMRGGLAFYSWPSEPQFIGDMAAVVNRYTVLDFSTGDTMDFSSIDVTGPYTAIVSDGIFYGLVVNGELVYDMIYTKITYNSSLDIYTLEKGLDKTTIRVAVNGSISGNLS